MKKRLKPPSDLRDRIRSQSTNKLEDLGYFLTVLRTYKTKCKCIIGRKISAVLLIFK